MGQPLSPAGRGQQISQCGLHWEFQGSQGYIASLCQDTKEVELFGLSKQTLFSHFPIFLFHASDLKNTITPY